MELGICYLFHYTNILFYESVYYCSITLCFDLGLFTENLVKKKVRPAKNKQSHGEQLMFKLVSLLNVTVFLL